MTYDFGHDPSELKRLITQAEVLRPVTEAMLWSIGLRGGSRVLDVGCGAGDVSMLIAELTDSTAEVIGIDRSSDAVDLAAARSKEHGLPNVSFRTSSLEDFHDPESFDFVVGRYVVLHQPLPVVFLGQAASKLRAGGTLAFHEIDLRKSYDSLPEVPLYTSVTSELMSAIRSGAPNPDADGRFVELFARAGLPPPTIRCERPVGDSKSSLIPWIASTVNAVRSLERGTAACEELERELAHAVGSVNSQIKAPDQCWACATV